MGLSANILKIMNPLLETAVVQFLANEFKMAPESLLPDTDFFIDLNLDRNQFTDLITRMQDALDFILPEEKINQISSLSDLFTSLAPEEAVPHESR